MSEDDFFNGKARLYVRPMDIAQPEKSIIISHEENIFLENQKRIENIKNICERYLSEEDMKYDEEDAHRFEVKTKLAGQIIRSNGDKPLPDSTQYILKKLFGFI